MDLCLGALATCQDITYKAYATAMGIPLLKVETTVEGDLDLRGFLGCGEGVRPGFQAIRGVVTLYSSATKEQLEQLKGAVDAHCPMCATVSQRVCPDLTVVKA